MSETRPIRVLLVDDDPMVCAGLELMLSVADDLEVVGAVHDGDQVIEALHRHAPDVLLLDVRMQRQDGITTVAAVVAQPRRPRIIMLTTFDHDDVVLRAVRAGADGFLLKTASPGEILTAVRSVVAGDGAVSPKAARQLFEHVQESAAPERRRALEALQSLSDREQLVVQCFARGLTNAEIGAELFVSEATVKTQLASAAHKLGARNRVEMAVLVTQAAGAR